MDYLPAIYQEDGFTRRFLSIFDSLYTDMDRAIDALPGAIDFDHARGDLLRYLAQWVCVEAGEGEALLRERIRTALSDYEDLYTVEGVRRSVRRLTGRDPILIEHFQVSPNRPGLQGPGALPPAVRGGPLPLLCPAAGGRLLQPAGAAAVPAGHGGGHSRGDDHADDPAQACVQLDWHTYLGINSRVGGYVPAAIDEQVTIHYDTTIGGANHESCQ